MMAGAMLGQFVRARRLALGLSQSALGLLVGTDKTVISKWENNVHIPGRRWSLDLAWALQVHPIEIVRRGHPNSLLLRYLYRLKVAAQI